MEATNDDVLRILISTDNHLGVWEKDEVRKDDSFLAFEEVFEIAEKHGADFVLLGGDLFHDNKPSRNTLVRTMNIMTRHCLGDRPVRFQVLSDQAQNFTTGRVNYEDPNYNIALPVMTIHGNHDDPAGAENLSAVDIMSTCRLVNYFGKAAIEGQGVGKLRISPVLLQKGATNVALYGLGNLRDERLCRLFATPGAVEWARPEGTEDVPREEWFNIFCLHQNRVAHTQGAKNVLRETALPGFLDFIVWGHEHECLADPVESVNGAFSLVQPGSSVATALAEGESKRKHCVMLEVYQGQWRFVKHPLDSVRPFQFATVSLAEQMELDPDQPEGVAEFLERKVQQMIDAAHRERSDRAPELPLIRLRVDYSGFSTINTQRFGQKFVGKVANPNDIVLWQKAPQRKAKDAGAAGGAGAAAGTLIRPEALDESRIEDLIGQHLQHNLEILQEQTLTDALHEFVEKDNKDSLKEAVGRALAETQNTTLHDRRAIQAEQDEDMVNVIKDVTQRFKESEAARSSQVHAQRVKEQQAQQQARHQQQQAANGLQQQVSAMQIEDDDDMMADIPARSAMGPPARRPPKAPPATASQRGKAAAPPPPRSRAAASRQTPLTFAPSSSRGSQRTSQGETGSLGTAPAAAAPAGRRGGSSRAAATKASQKMAQQLKHAGPAEDEAEDDDEVNVIDLAADDSEGIDSDSSEDASGLEEEEEELEPPASATRKRGRAAPAAAAPAAAGRRRGAAAQPHSQRTGGAVSHVISDDEEDAPATGRRRVGGVGVIPGGRSQAFGGPGL
ncbi:Double-strand break repair MRE11 [Micractinium conductrix]|uniref:Double-strand break repair protein n=1 Tax=Micractinium conductrix TaxID=554055 RepID=A0A2P6VB97_9CHLO|nr:Double-strand break repair MRE11 [Micractinium conductrix]|eukprot:PSC71365.1 Double-strand break repair MRE11 [Micractinium conductrix]